MCRSIDYLQEPVSMILLIWDGQISISYYEKYKEQVSFHTMVVGNLVLVHINGNKTLVIDLVLYVQDVDLCI